MHGSTLTRVNRFAVTFTYPYMETADTPHHVDLGGKLGFIYGSLSALAFLFGWFFIPETKQVEIEDLDKQFAVFELVDVEDPTKGAPAVITELPQ